MALKLNAKKRDFILQFILNARLSGRQTDIDGESDRRQIVDAAGDLYDKAVEKSMHPVKDDD
ncbi:hypothetical protein D3C81_334840 [compost metagenome]